MLLDLLPLQQAAQAPVRAPAPTPGNALGTFYIQAAPLCLCHKGRLSKKCPTHCKAFVERQHAEDELVLLSL